MRRVAALMVGALAVLTVVTACGGPSASSTGSPGAASPSPSAYAVPDDFTIQIENDVTDGSAHRLTSSDAELVGPNSFIRLDALETTQTLAASQTDEFVHPNQPKPGAIHASAGHEFVLAHVAKDVKVRPPLTDLTGDGAAMGPANIVPASVVVDGKARSLGQILADQTIIILAPTGATVTLELNDGDRPQDLDLRTGKRTRSGSPLYYPLRTAYPEMMGELLSYNSAAGVDIDVDYVALEPYEPHLGWAPAGRAWLDVTAHMTSVELPHAFTADAKKSLTVTIGGTMVTAKESGADQLPAGLNEGMTRAEFYAIFSVPASTRSGTLNFLLTGSYAKAGKVTAVGGTQRAKFTLQPDN